MASPPDFLSFRVKFLASKVSYITGTDWEQEDANRRWSYNPGMSERDPSSFGVLVDKYKAGIYAFVYDKLRDFHDAQDVTQEVFEKAYISLRSLRHWESFAFWLHRIARNLCINWIRDQSRRPDREFISDQDPKTLATRSLGSYRENQLDESLQEALDSLPDSYREVLLLHYFGGMTIKDMARSLGASPTAIGARLSRGRAKLKEEMIAMMDTAFEGHKLQSGFTFRIVEMVRRIRIAPVPPRVWPWGFSIATGIIIAILGIGTHLNLTTTESYTSISSLSGESMVQEVGEFPVDVMKMSDATITSIQQLAGDGLGNVVPDIGNALFMAPQAEGGTWTKKADMPIARFIFSTSPVNGKIYVIGGNFVVNNKTVNLLTVEEYDPILENWIKKADMITARTGLSTCVANGRIYAMGGYLTGQGKEFKLVEEYDPARDKWSRRADMLTERQFFSINEIGGKIYAIGGWRVGKALSTTEEYDPWADKWTKKADMPAPRYGFSASVVNGRIYVIGGCHVAGSPIDGRNAVSTVEEYDPVTNTWTKKTDMPTARVFLTTNAVGGKIYAIGGRRMEGDLTVQLSAVEEYDPLLDRWTKKTDMPTKRDWFASSAVNGKIYVMGGYVSGRVNGRNFSKEISAIEEYDTGFAGQSINFKGKLPTTWGEVRTALN